MMSAPIKFSVIIPSYNGADYLGAAIESVLGQSYEEFEIIVVDDVSKDNTAEIVSSFNDPRVHYILHEENRGANSARNTGIKASSGNVIAFLDQDDLFHREKLEYHAKFLQDHPDVGFTYNARFNLNHSATTIRDIWEPPESMTLPDLVLGFPLSPSEMVVKKYWLDQAGYWDETKDFNGGEITFAGRLFLSGCKFGNVHRALNYRRYYSARKFGHLQAKCRAERSAQERMLSDPRCPEDVKSLRNLAFANSNLIWAYTAFAQDETALGQELVREAIQLKPSLLDENAREIRYLFTYHAAVDENEDHDALIHKIASQMPVEVEWSKGEIMPAVAYGYLIKGTRAAIWERPQEAQKYFSKCRELQIKPDDAFLKELAHQLSRVEIECGEEYADEAFARLRPFLDSLGGSQITRSLASDYLINSAFYWYQHQNYHPIPKKVLNAIVITPKLIGNRGVISIFLRSAIKNMLISKKISALETR